MQNSLTFPWLFPDWNQFSLTKFIVFCASNFDIYWPYPLLKSTLLCNQLYLSPFIFEFTFLLFVFLDSFLLHFFYLCICTCIEKSSGFRQVFEIKINHNTGTTVGLLLPHTTFLTKTCPCITFLKYIFWILIFFLVNFVVVCFIFLPTWTFIYMYEGLAGVYWYLINGHIFYLLLN